jgi:hypothetical protein
MGRDTRFKRTVHAPYDVVTAQSDGSYKVTAGQGPVAQTWSYLDPEDASRITQWATGLSILVRI